MKIVSTVLLGVMTTFAAAANAGCGSPCGNPCKPVCPQRCAPVNVCSPCYNYSPITYRCQPSCKPCCKPTCVKKCWYDSCCKRHCKKVCY